MRPRSSAIAAACLLAIAAVACGGGGADTPGTNSTTTAATRPASTAVLAILAPKDGETIKGTSFTVRIDLKNATVIPTTSNDVRPDTGHLHVVLDGKTVSQTYGTEQKVDGVVPGLHALSVEFVAADHSPFNPRVIERISFRTEA